LSLSRVVDLRAGGLGMTFGTSDNAVSVSHGQDLAEAAIEGELAHPAQPPSATRVSALVVVGAGALLFGGFGTAYAVPVFFPALHRDLAIPLPHLTALFSSAGALYFSLGVMSGPLADRIGARIVAAIGCVVLAGGLVIMSRAGDEPVFDIAYLFGVGVGVGLCFVPTVGAVQVLCRENPAVAGAVAASGIGLGTFVLPSLAQLLIDHIGWRQTLLLLGVLAACGGLAALPLAESGTVNDRDRVPHSSPSPPRLAELMRSRRFLLLYVAQLLISLVAFVPFAHLALFAKTKGWPIATGGYLIGVIGIGSLCARLLVGIVAQSHGSCRTASLCAVLMAVALGLLLLSIDRWELCAAAALYGLGYGGVIGLTGPIVAEVLGVRGICTSVGFVTTSRALGILVGPSAVGLSAHRLGGYDLPFLACAALAATAAILLAALYQSTASCHLPKKAHA
jgi:MFS family permease